jgi:hypothetical protein
MKVNGVILSGPLRTNFRTPPQLQLKLNRFRKTPYLQNGRSPHENAVKPLAYARLGAAFVRQL